MKNLQCTEQLHHFFMNPNALYLLEFMFMACNRMVEVDRDSKSRQNSNIDASSSTVKPLKKH